MPRRLAGSSKEKGKSNPDSISDEVATVYDLKVATEVVTKQASDHYIDVRGWHNEIRHAIGINDPYGEILPEDNTILKELHRLRADKVVLRAENKAGLQKLLDTVVALSAEERELRERGMGRPPQTTARRPPTPMPPSTPHRTLAPVNGRGKREPMSPPPRPCKSKGKRMRKNPSGRRPLGARRLLADSSIAGALPQPFPEPCENLEGQLKRTITSSEN